MFKTIVILLIFAYAAYLIVSSLAKKWRKKMNEIKAKNELQAEQEREAAVIEHHQKMAQKKQEKEEQQRQEAEQQAERQKELETLTIELQKARELCAATPGLNLLDMVIANGWHNGRRWYVILNLLTFADFCQYWQTKMQHQYWGYSNLIKEIDQKHSFDECMEWLGIIGQSAFSSEACLSIVNRAPDALRRYKAADQLLHIGEELAQELWQQLQNQLSVTNDEDEATAIKSASQSLSYRIDRKIRSKAGESLGHNFGKAMVRIKAQKLKDVFECSYTPEMLAEAVNQFANWKHLMAEEEGNEMLNSYVEKFLSRCQSPTNAILLKFGGRQQHEWIVDFYTKAIQACNSDEDLENLRAGVVNGHKGRFDDKIVKRSIELKLSQANS